jgi:hypothetical protein
MKFLEMMMTNEVVVYEDLQELMDRVDMSRLVPYRKKLADIDEGFSKLKAPSMMRDFTIAYDLASNILAKAIYAEIKIKSALDQAEAIAFLDKAPDYFTAKGQKMTNEGRKAYVALDAQVISAKDMLAHAQAAVSLLKNLVQEFRMAGDAVKKLYDDGYLSKYEGN